MLTRQSLPAGPLAPRRDASAVWTGERMIVWGGYSGDQAGYTDFADGAAYDPASRRWTPIATSPLSARAEQVAVWTGDRMLVWGGVSRAGDRPMRSWSDGAAYDPVADRWRRIARAPLPGVRQPVAVPWGDRVAFVVPQLEKVSSESHPNHAVLVYHPGTDPLGLRRGRCPASGGRSVRRGSAGGRGERRP